ncbi:hypothetical protein TorRG33x02_113670 [Trema orientale]|uniref:Uncharacterized protein n=1 Tax=Trema orientale TaxID=63057 RepID=A0A2P5F4V7_TREOI|nr:hypothetical protein TorRG33x02_113670 [Trema orientale]
MKNVNYLPNLPSKRDVEEKRAYYVAECPSLNVAFITSEKSAGLHKILSGCTAKRLVEYWLPSWLQKRI